jgi:hypothetical protein
MFFLALHFLSLTSYIVHRSRGTSHHRGYKALSNSWFLGAIVTSSTTADQNKVVVAFSFNEDNQGWHYAWQSHPMARQTKHCLHVFILAARREERSYTNEIRVRGVAILAVVRYVLPAEAEEM